MVFNKVQQTLLSLAVLAVVAPSAGLAAGSGKSSAASSAPAPQAAAPGSSATPAPGEEKLDVTDLENKYWSAKDTDFSVVQNRLFTKAGRYSLSLDYGTFLNDSWSNDPTYELNASYYFSERYGITATFDDVDSQDNQATQHLVGQSGYPDHNLVKSYYGVSFNWVPFYAKMSLLNSSIIYFDMAISPGLGMTNYEQRVITGDSTKSAPTLSLDITQHFFLNKHFAVRVDLKNRWYQNQIMSFKSGSQTSNDVNSVNILMLGFTYFF